jgi:hypothetical protein
MRAFWISFDRISGFLAIIALAAPFVLALWGMRREQRDRPPASVPHFGFFSCAGCAVGSVLGICLLFMVTCFGPPSGRGEAAEMGYAIAAPILSALERYHADHASYPESLRTLVPGYLSASRIPIPQDEPGDLGQEGFAYLVDSSGFTLGFRYTGPGINRCVYKSTTKHWSCSGYF